MATSLAEAVMAETWIRLEPESAPPWRPGALPPCPVGIKGLAGVMEHQEIIPQRLGGEAVGDRRCKTRARPQQSRKAASWGSRWKSRWRRSRAGRAFRRSPPAAGRLEVGDGFGHMRR